MPIPTLYVLDPETVRRIQEKIGLPENQQDGELGPVTLRAIDAFLDEVAKFVAGQIGKTPIPAPVPTLPPTAVAPIRARAIPLPELVAINAEEEEGVREQGGNNKGPRVQEYQAATWLEGTGWAWCAAFVCFVIRDAIKGLKVTFERPLTAGAYDFERWALEQAKNGVQLFKPRTQTKIKRGDILTFANISHIAIAVADEKDGRVETIEGNTGDDGGREGDGVYRNSRKLSEIRSVIRLPRE